MRATRRAARKRCWRVRWPSWPPAPTDWRRWMACTWTWTMTRAWRWLPRARPQPGLRRQDADSSAPDRRRQRGLCAQPREIAVARKRLQAWRDAQASGQGVAVVDGSLVENLHAREAERVLALAAAIAAPSARARSPSSIPPRQPCNGIATPARYNTVPHAHDAARRGARPRAVPCPRAGRLNSRPEPHALHPATRAVCARGGTAPARPVSASTMIRFQQVSRARRRRCSTKPTCCSTPATRSASSAPTAPASPACSRCCAACCTPTRAT